MWPAPLAPLARWIHRPQPTRPRDWPPAFNEILTDSPASSVTNSCPPRVTSRPSSTYDAGASRRPRRRRLLPQAAPGRPNDLEGWVRSAWYAAGGSDGDAHQLGVQVLDDPLAAALATEAAFLGASERSSR